MTSWFAQFIQSIDWNTILTAAIFGALGFLAKSLVDFYREREIKKTERDLERDTLKWEEQRAFMLETLKILFALNDRAARLLDVLDHAQKLAVRPDDKVRRLYIVRGVGIHTTELLAALDNTKSVQLYVALPEHSVQELARLSDEFKGYLSEQGVLKDYQVQLAATLANRGKSLPVDKGEARKQLEGWAKTLVADFEAAIYDLEHGNKRQYPSLEERALTFPSRKFNSRGLRLTDNSAEFVSIVHGIMKFVAEQSLIKVYRDGMAISTWIDSNRVQSS